MQNIKNFRLSEPTQHQLKQFENDEGYIPLFLQSENGVDWYECQSLFSDNTIKLEYDSNGIIYRVVDKPVPERGNTLAVSMLWPNNASVAEVESLPEGFRTDGTWVYSDGQVIQSADYVVAKNRRSQIRRADYAAAMLSMLQASESTGTSQDGDADYIRSLQEYLSDLRHMTLTVSEPAWPTLPSFIL